MAALQSFPAILLKQPHRDVKCRRHIVTPFLHNIWLACIDLTSEGVGELSCIQTLEVDSIGTWYVRVVYFTSPLIVTFVRTFIYCTPGTTIDLHSPIIVPVFKYFVDSCQSVTLPALAPSLRVIKAQVSHKKHKPCFPHSSCKDRMPNLLIPQAVEIPDILFEHPPDVEQPKQGL